MATSQTAVPAKQGRFSGLWAFLGLLLFVGGGVASAIWIAPGVLTDLQVRNPEPINGRITSGKCSNRLFIHLCDATLQVQTKSGPVASETHIAFFDLHVGDYTAGVVADRDHPEWVTTTLALDHLWSRVVTLLVFWAFILAILIPVTLSGIRRLRGSPAPAAR